MDLICKITLTVGKRLMIAKPVAPPIVATKITPIRPTDHIVGVEVIEVDEDEAVVAVNFEIKEMTDKAMVVRSMHIRYRGYRLADTLSQ